MNRRSWSRTALGAALLSLGDTTVLAQTPEKFIFALNWFPVGDHAAYWVALDKGYFAKAGLDVTLQNSKGSSDSIAKVDTGRADAGLADASTVIAADARGATVKMVGMVFDKTPLNFFSRADNPVRTPKQLEGKTVGAPVGDAQRQAWPAFVKLEHIDQSKVTWISIEPSAKMAALAQKRVDVVADYTTGLPFYVKALGGRSKVVMMPWSEFGFDMYSMSIMASEKTMKERPKALRAFLQAAYMGWRDVMNDPKAALAIFKRRVPEIDLSIIEPNMMMGIDLMRTQNYKNNGIGWIDEKRMCHTVDIVNTYMGLPRKVDCKSVYTTEFLTKVPMPLAVK